MVETPVIRTVSIRKELTKLVIPIFIETLLIMMLGAVDTIMLSQYSDESVAAVGVVNQIVMFAFLIFEVINIGTSVLCSQYLGAGLRKKMVQVVGVSLLLNLAVGVLVSLILHFGSVARIAAASVDDLASLVGRELAERIHKSLNAGDSGYES